MPTTPDQDVMQKLTLGQMTAYPAAYDADLLQAVPRALNRQPIGIDDHNLPFYGMDEWTGYELSWLNQSGLPQVAIARFMVPADSPNLVESKSFKLYLNSFNQARFAHWSQVANLMQQDLSRCAGRPVEVTLFTLQEFAQTPLQAMPGHCLDTQDIGINTYDYAPHLLGCSDSAEIVEESVYSDLLKSNCLITNQPDWGSISIDYRGPRIDHAALLAYIVSFRNHNEFHEQCVERIFQDLMRHCNCQQLTVSARYTRRGGLDINPLRSSQPVTVSPLRTVRQ